MVIITIHQRLLLCTFRLYALYIELCAKVLSAR